jgi:hypothetical protein
VSSSRQALAGRAVVRARTAAGLSGICLSLAAASAAATDYELNPWVELGGGYDDNVLLAPSGANKISAGDAIADARVELLAQELNWQLLATPEVRGNWFPSQSGLDTNAEFLTLNGQRSGPRYTLSLGAYASSQSLITGYLPTTAVGAGLGQIEPGTTLVTPGNIRQNLGSLSPSYTLQMTPRTSLQLNAGYTDSTYSRSLPAYVEYKNATGSAGLVFAASPTSSVTLRATGADFRPDSGRTAGTAGAEVQWDGKYSETKQYYLRIGAEHTDFSGAVTAAPLVSGTTNWSAGAGTHWTYNLTEIFIDATRNVAPTPQGYAVNLDQLRLRLAHRLTPRFAAFLGARAIYESPLDGAVPAVPVVHATHYNYATTGFEWRLQREFSVIAEYSFTEYHYNTPPGQANSILLSFVYEPHRPAEGPAVTVPY